MFLREVFSHVIGYVFFFDSVVEKGTHFKNVSNYIAAVDSWIAAIGACLGPLAFL